LVPLKHVHFGLTSPSCGPVADSSAEPQEPVAARLAVPDIVELTGTAAAADSLGLELLAAMNIPAEVALVQRVELHH